MEGAIISSVVPALSPILDAAVKELYNVRAVSYTHLFFPFLLCISWFVGILYLDIQSFLEPLEKIIPGNLLAVLSAYLEYVANSSVALLIGCLLYTSRCV